MSDKISDEVFETLPKKPNFLLIVILSGITLVVLLAAAYLLVSDDGKKLLHGSTPNAHAALYVLPETPSAIDSSAVCPEHPALTSVLT